MNYRMPAEWEPHEATWLAWPHNEDDWPDKFEPIPWVFVEVVKKLSTVEKVCILVQPEQADWMLGDLELAGVNLRRIQQHRVLTNRVWTRDFAPVWVFDPSGSRHTVKWRFNAWAKYDNWELDQAAGLSIANEQGPLIEPAFDSRSIVLEGGSIDVNGQGLLLTTEECLLSEVQQRNPGLTSADYESLFAKFLGIEKVLWLKRGIAGDDTHGHVDDLARFVNANTVACVSEDDQGDENYEPLRENLELLRGMTDQHGRPLKIVELPMPSQFIFDGQRLPASYANFYIANGLVLVPTFNDERDRQALSILADLFPDRRVIGIHCGDLVWGLGTIHCMTMQQPASRLMA